MNYIVTFIIIVASAHCCASASTNTRKDRKSLKEQIVGLNYTIYNLVAALKRHEDFIANLSPLAQLKRVPEPKIATVGTATEESTTLAEELIVNSNPLIKLQRDQELENVTVGTSAIESATFAQDLEVNSTPWAKSNRIQGLDNVAIGTSTEESITSAEDLMVNLTLLVNSNGVHWLENGTVETSTEKSTTLAQNLMENLTLLANSNGVQGLENGTVVTPAEESTTLAQDLMENLTLLAKSNGVQRLENGTMETSTEESTTLAEGLTANSSPLANNNEVQGLENAPVETSPVTFSTSAVDLNGIVSPNETSCVEFIELDQTAEVTRPFAKKLHPVSCMWVVWAKRGGPITIHSLFKDNDDNQPLQSNFSLFVLNHNVVFGGYIVTELDVGMKMNFSTDYLNAEGFYPFVVIHALAPPSESDQLVHLKLWDQGAGFKFELSKTVQHTNPTKIRRGFVDFPLPQNHVLVTHDRRFILGHAEDDKSVRLTIAPREVPIGDFVEIQVSWLNATSRSVEQRSYNNGMRKGKIEIDLEPSTTFVIAFSSLQEGDVKSSFRVGYKYY